MREGKVQVPGGAVWYQVLGRRYKPAVVVLHGGPGYPHDYLEPLSELADKYQVVFYDQLGCGKSDRPDNPRLWTIERFVEELNAVCRALRLKPHHLFGHSWGSILAVEYALRYPQTLRSLVLASPCLSITRWCEDAAQLTKMLPETLQQTLAAGESGEDSGSAQYQEATEEYYRNFVCRLCPKPEAVLRSDAEAGGQVYTTMWGPTEFIVTGNLRAYDCTPRLFQLRLPVLYTCGQLDEAQPATTEFYREMTPGANSRVFLNSSHLPHWEERRAYLSELRAFMSGVERALPWWKRWLR